MSQVAQRLHEVEQLGGVGQSDTAVFASANGNASAADCLRGLSTQWSIDSNAIVHSTRPKLGPWIIRFQQTVRRFTWWFTNPLLDQIVTFNSNVVRTINAVQTDLDRVGAETQTQTSRIDVLYSHLGGKSAGPVVDPVVVAKTRNEKTCGPNDSSTTIRSADLEAELRETRDALALLTRRLEVLERTSLDQIVASLGDK
jgi:hypothetical protein